MIVKFTVKTEELKKGLKVLDNFLKKGYTLFFQFDNEALRLWVRNHKIDEVLEYSISYSELEMFKPISWFALDKKQLKEFKKAIRNYKNEYITIELKENRHYSRFILKINGSEIFL